MAKLLCAHHSSDLDTKVERGDFLVVETNEGNYLCVLLTYGHLDCLYELNEGYLLGEFWSKEWPTLSQVKVAIEESFYDEEVRNIKLIRSEEALISIGLNV